MALFGFGKYSEKTFVNNTADFRDRIQRLIDDCMGIPGVGASLNKVLLALDKNEYPRQADSKELQDIDERIKNLFSTMENDLQQKSRAKLSAHANMILDAVLTSRKYGKEKTSPALLAAENRMAELYARIEDLLDQKANVKADMDDIYRKSQKLSDDDPQLDLLDAKYGACEQQMNEIDARFQEVKAEYSVQAQELNVMLDDMFYDDLPQDISTPQEFAKMAAQVNEKRAKRAEIRGAKSDIANEYASEKRATLGDVQSKQSGLRARRSMEEQERINNEIGTTTVANQNASSGLKDRLMNNH